jgi:dTMP kinase
MLRERLARRGYETSVIDKWDILDHERFPECRFIGVELDELKRCMASMPGISRALMLFWTLAITLTRPHPEGADHIYLLDGYWMKHAAAEIALGCDAEWVLATVRRLPAPDLTLYLDVTPEVAVQRKGSFNLMECGLRPDLGRGSFLTHQRRLRRHLLRWCDEFGWARIQATFPPQDVAASIDGAVAPLVSRVTPRRAS